MTDGSRRAIVAALLANLGIALAKLVAFLVTGAASMLAEAVHSVADTGNQALLLLGGARAKRSATAEHPFGYGRERYFWAFVVALVLFTLGSLFAIGEGVQKLRDPHEIVAPGWALGVLAVAIVLESFSLRTAVHEARRAKGAESWWSFVRHSKSPELPVVLLEDLGALLGLVLAALGVGLAMLLGDPRFDALGSVAIGVLLGAIAVVLAVEMKSLLIGEGASPADLAAIADAFASAPGVRRVIHLRTLHLGPDELLVAAKVEIDPGQTGPVLAGTIDAAESHVRARVPSARVIYVEPDVFRS
ncbi:MAG: cation diffusion facilitator family transporter [Deltaproteobacteria bacterium]|nr:cation diffusion facilitator family transporter [Deltaproteobacteria bacterium]